MRGLRGGGGKSCGCRLAPDGACLAGGGRGRSGRRGLRSHARGGQGSDPASGNGRRLGPAVGRSALACRPARLASHLVHAAASGLTAHDRGEPLVDKIEIGGAVLGPIRNAQDLKEVTERRLQSGGRFVTIESNVRPDTSMGTECVQVDAVQEERNNPRFPDAVLVLVSHAVDCLHPRSPGYVVSVSYSERYPKGQQRFSAKTLRAEGEPFIRSATLTLVR